MRFLLNALTTLALRLRWLTLAMVVLLLGLGGVAALQLNQELLPPVEFPQTVVLAQASGVSSEQALTVLTERLEPALQAVENVVNIESQTTGAFGAIITVFSDFGIDQDALRDDMRDAISTVWLPQRRVSPEEGQDAVEFAEALLGDITPEIMLYFADLDSNFLFQLEPSVWELLPDDTVTAAAAYLATQTDAGANQGSALERLVDKELVPQLQALDVIANVQLQGGQALPGQDEGLSADVDAEPQSLLLRIAPDIWAAIAPHIAGIDDLNQDAVDTLLEIEFTLPEDAPVLPESWQFPGFNDASDIVEMGSLTRSVAGVMNEFSETGTIIGALGQTDDLTLDAFEQMLAIEPTMVEYFEAEQIAALPADVFAALPTDVIDSLDGFGRDQLAAAELAAALTGEDVQPDPVDLPSQWRIGQPQLLFFSFSDLPLATFSVTSTGVPSADNSPDEDEGSTETTEDADEMADSQTALDLPEGPELPQLFGLFGTFLGSDEIELDTADDLVQVALPAELADTFGADTIAAADFINLLAQFSDLAAAGGGEAGGEAAGLPDFGDFNPTQFVPAFAECGIGLPQLLGGDLDIGAAIIGCLDADVLQYLVDNDPEFATALQPAVFEYFSDEILLIDGIAPPLPSEWNVLAEQPEFAEMPLQTADDLVALGGGSPSTALNTLNNSVPEPFAGYEVRLFNSLTPLLMGYFRLQEPDFWPSLDREVVLKLSPEELAEAPLFELNGVLAQSANLIAIGQSPSAFEELADQYSSELPPADPDAPELNPAWANFASFLGIELDSADDFFRFPEGFIYADASELINSLYASAQGANFAPTLLSVGTPLEAWQYILDRDPAALDDLSAQALSDIPDESLAIFPQALQDRAAEGGEQFEPNNAVTRTDGNPSLFLTVFKTGDASTVAAYLEVEDFLQGIDAGNDEIEIGVVFEQASFIQDSIAGVAREGTLGAIFAVIIILLFLSTRQKIAWRATIVIAISIPLSVLSSLVLMRWLSPALNGVFAPLADTSPIFALLATIFPEELTLNIMTLSGLTVAVGRVVDDSIVVLENIFRQIQQGGDKRDVVLQGTRDVAAAILTATSIAIVVFLPLGLTGGLIGSFFLPFGLAVMFALVGSFIVAVTVIPVVSFLVISEKDVPPDEDFFLARFYLPVLRLALSSTASRFIVLALALATLPLSGYLLSTRPATFLPDFGEPQITVAVELPSEFKMLDTNELVVAMEETVPEIISEEQLGRVQTTIGGSAGLSIDAFFGGGSVSENAANLTIGLQNLGPDDLNTLAGDVRVAAQDIFGVDNVTVSGGTLSGGGFGGLALVVSGPQEDIESVNDLIIETMEGIDGITNVTSSLGAVGEGGDTVIRVNQQSAISYSAELETENSIGVTEEALEALQSLEGLPDTVTVGQGFDSEIQSEGFNSFPRAFAISISFMYIILAFSFRSPIYPLAVFGSLLVMPVGAAIGLWISDRVLGISALIGFLMLLGLVIANAVVLLDRVRSNMEERDMEIYDALLEAGNRRLRPILMTSLATIIALTPLTIGLSEGAIIASELGTVVIGGVFSSTILTLIIVPVLYSLLYPLNTFVMGFFTGGNNR